MTNVEYDQDDRQVIVEFTELVSAEDPLFKMKRWIKRGELRAALID